jgi:hypothetical protein
LLDIAWVEGLSLSELIKGQRVKVNTPEVCREPQRVPKQFKRVDHDALREAMRAAARDGRSASDVARELDVDLSTMARHADLYATLRRHTSHQQLADDTFRRNAAVYEARQMAERLLEAGAPVTLRNANDKSGDRWMPAQLRSQTLSIIARELDERDDSACTKVSAQTKAMAIEAANDLVKAKNPQASR